MLEDAVDEDANVSAGRDQTRIAIGGGVPDDGDHLAGLEKLKLLPNLMQLVEAVIDLPDRFAAERDVDLPYKCAHGTHPSEGLYLRLIFCDRDELKTLVVPMHRHVRAGPSECRQLGYIFFHPGPPRAHRRCEQKSAHSWTCPCRSSPGWPLTTPRDEVRAPASPSMGIRILIEVDPIEPAQ